jgi:hypothetical protein
MMLLIIFGALFVAGLVMAEILSVTLPVAMTTYGRLALNYLKRLSRPACTLSTEANPAYSPSEGDEPAISKRV